VQSATCCLSHVLPAPQPWAVHSCACIMLLLPLLLLLLLLLLDGWTSRLYSCCRTFCMSGHTLMVLFDSSRQRLRARSPECAYCRSRAANIIDVSSPLWAWHVWKHAN
jgi:hypothetical protein